MLLVAVLAVNRTNHHEFFLVLIRTDFRDLRSYKKIGAFEINRRPAPFCGADTAVANGESLQPIEHAGILGIGINTKLFQNLLNAVLTNHGGPCFQP